MAMEKTEDDHEPLFPRMLAYGDDSTPVMASVPEQAPSGWGKLTSQARTLSPAYMQFLERNRNRKEARDG